MGTTLTVLGTWTVSFCWVKTLYNASAMKLAYPWEGSDPSTGAVLDLTPQKPRDHRQRGCYCLIIFAANSGGKALPMARLPSTRRSGSLVFLGKV